MAATTSHVSAAHSAKPSQKCLLLFFNGAPWRSASYLPPSGWARPELLRAMVQRKRSRSISRPPASHNRAVAFSSRPTRIRRSHLTRTSWAAISEELSRGTDPQRAGQDRPLADLRFECGSLLRSRGARFRLLPERSSRGLCRDLARRNRRHAEDARARGRARRPDRPRECNREWPCRPASDIGCRKFHFSVRIGGRQKNVGY